jgi:hypothetical protein
MPTFPIDLHLELSNLRNFVNDQINSENPYSLDGKEFYEILKRVVIDAEVKPFLTFPKDESEINYYEKYRRQSQEVFNKLIPDFFEYEGEFYDLDRVQYAHKDFIRAEDFERLFIIKLLELKSNNYPLREFLTFQQFDSFYGQKESIDSFLYQLTEKDSNCHLLQKLCQLLKDWIGSQSLELLEQSSEESKVADESDSIIEQVDSQEEWEKETESLKGKRIKCNWSMEQILQYFSYLYKEKSEDGKPYVTKEQVDKMFENGFKIPDHPIDPLIKPNFSKRYPFKNITFGINQFYTRSRIKYTDKRAYFQFFSMYIDGYARFMASPKVYENFSRNTSKALPSRTIIKWEQYLPPDSNPPKPSL